MDMSLRYVHQYGNDYLADFENQEGAVFFVLMRTSRARANGYPILAFIRSLATGHNGSTHALTAPNVFAQMALTQRCLRAAGLSPYDVDILEGEWTVSLSSDNGFNRDSAHGTGTRLGDAMEAEAFRSIYDDEKRDRSLWVSSSKTLFGHTQAASMFVGEPSFLN